ncbi:GT4 family glycosyltransferase PelF [Brevibacillus formosus]|uniref:GT4 family glycosyltransferase PelF n=1 Tax=Brevibacillus formosus TaxID=54913 RepID=UPI0018CF303B|nr:GT4 family glycosyltransferase PelF [Brevibacillus formosus]MBG9943244.1 glycosyl transferase [Brevibacillus formosus]
MKICLIAEGSYPYITGGVSSWIHSLIASMPEHEFIIYAIGAEEKNRGKYVYQLPSNVIEIREIFLDAYLKEEAAPGKRLGLTEDEQQALLSLLDGSKGDWRALFSVLSGSKVPSVAELLTSKDYFEVIQRLCEEKYPQIPFTEMIWMIRSMVLPLCLVIQNGMPQADLYHSVCTGYGGVAGSLGKYLHAKPFLLTEHGIYTREREEEIIKANWIKGHFKDIWIDYFHNLSACAYSYADEVITLFERNKEIQIELGCDPSKVSVIPNGVKVSDYADIVEEKKDDTITIGAVVRVVPIKDIKTMLQSFGLVKEQVPQARFVIMGPTDEDEEYYTECLQLVDSLQLEDVTFTGAVNVKQYLGKMDMLVLTSISEGQPLVILEGMACRKPFVTTDVGSCRELLYGNGDNYGNAGITVPVMHFTQIAQAIITLCQNEPLRRRMGRCGFQRVSAIYTHENFLAGYRNMYRKYEV